MEATRGRRAAAAACAAVLACGLAGAALAAPGTAEAKGAKKPAKVKVKSVKVSKAGKMTVRVAKAKHAKKYRYKVWGAGLATWTCKTKRRTLTVAVRKARGTVRVKVRAYAGKRCGGWSRTVVRTVPAPVKKAAAKGASPAPGSAPEGSGDSGKPASEHAHKWRTETVHRDATWYEEQLTENGFFECAFADPAENNAVRMIPDPNTWAGDIYWRYMDAVPEGYHNQFGLNCMVEDKPAYDATYRVCDTCGKRELVKKTVHKHRWKSRTVHHDRKTVSGDIVWYYVYKDKDDAEPVFKTTNPGGAQCILNIYKDQGGYADAEIKRVVVHEDDHVVCPAYDETFKVCSDCGAEKIASIGRSPSIVRPGMHSRMSASTMYVDSHGNTIITY